MVDSQEPLFTEAVAILGSPTRRVFGTTSKSLMLCPENCVLRRLERTTPNLIRRVQTGSQGCMCDGYAVTLLGVLEDTI